MTLLLETLSTRQLIVLFFLFMFFLSFCQIPVAALQDINSNLPVCNKSQNSFVLNSSSSVIQNFTSPNYPQNYPLYSNCIWVVIAPLGHLIKLTFSAFSIYTTSGDSAVQRCPYAYVQVIEEDTKGNSEIIGRFCGSRTPQTIYSSGGNLKVVFKNTLLTSAKGFVAKYSAVSKGLACSSQNTIDENSNILLQKTATGLIKPPQFPDSYSGPIDCTWKIALPQNNAINITLISFTIKEQATCIDSSLEVYNGRYGIGHGARLGLFCDNTKTQSVFSSGRYLSLRWRAKNPKLAVDFQMAFKAVKQTKSGSCDASSKEVYLSGIAGSIFTPGYPNKYPNSIDCTWRVTVPQGFYVRLKFESFQLEAGSSCSDNVEVKDGKTQLAKLCGSSLPKIIVSSTQNMHITFRSNFAKSGKGFLAVFEATTGTQAPKLTTTPGTQAGVCSPLNTNEMNNNIKLSGSSGFVASPMYPSQYPNSIKCTWRISVSSSKRIHLVFEDFWIDDQVGCHRDYLEIRDGSQKSSPQIGERNCGNKKPGEVYSTGSSLWLQFVSDAVGTSHGFKARYSAISKPFNRFIAVGIGIGALALVLIAILVFWKIKKKRNKGEDEQYEDQSDVGTLDRVTTGNALLGDSPYEPPNEYVANPVPMETINNHDNLKDNSNNEFNDEFAWFKPSKRKSKGFESTM